jgi:integrase
MPHFPKPFFKAKRGCWYVEIDRHQHNLGPDRDAAFALYHELMRKRPRPIDCTHVVGVLDAFLGWVKDNKSERTFEWYERHLSAFAKALPPLLLVGQLAPHHVTEAMGKHPGWSSSTKNGFCRAVLRAFRWAEDEELIDRSPLKKLKKPKSKRREVVIPEAEFEYILTTFRNEDFKDLLVTVWETGCRPQEAANVEARHVDLALGRWVFPIDESKGQTLPRVVYLTEAALHITKKLVLRHPEGPLFRNEDGKPWTRHALACAFGRLQIIMGLRRMKELGVGIEPLKRFKRSDYPDKAALREARALHQKELAERRKALYKVARRYGRKYCFYNLRHSWATRALRRGVDPLTVAILMGHSDPSMLAKVYAHLAQDPEFMAKAARKAAGG